MSRKLDTMDMLRRAMEGSALAGGAMGGMYGAALAGGAIDTYGNVKKKTERKERLPVYRNGVFNSFTVQRAVKNAPGVKGPAKKVPHQVTEKEYMDMQVARKATAEVNDRVLSQEVKKRLTETGARRLSGRELLLLKYDVRNKTRYIKRALKAKNEKPNYQILGDLAYRADFGGGHGGSNRGKYSDAEKKERAVARAEIAAQPMTAMERAKALGTKYAEIAKRHKATRTYKKPPPVQRGFPPPAQGPAPPVVPEEKFSPYFATPNEKSVLKLAISTYARGAFTDEEFNGIVSASDDELRRLVDKLHRETKISRTFDKVQKFLENLDYPKYDAAHIYGMGINGEGA